MRYCTNKNLELKVFRTAAGGYTVFCRDEGSQFREGMINLFASLFSEKCKGSTRHVWTVSVDCLLDHRMVCFSRCLSCTPDRLVGIGFPTTLSGLLGRHRRLGWWQGGPSWMVFAVTIIIVRFDLDIIHRFVITHGRSIQLASNCCSCAILFNLSHERVRQVHVGINAFTIVLFSTYPSTCVRINLAYIDILTK